MEKEILNQIFLSHGLLYLQMARLNYLENDQVNGKINLLCSLMKNWNDLLIKTFIQQFCLTLARKSYD